MSNQKVVKFSDLQNQKQMREQRKVERVLVNNILYAFVVLPEKGLLKVDPIDLSEENIGFSLPKGYGMFKKGEELAFRLYFSQQDYIPFIVKVVRREILRIDGIDMVQYGCLLDVETEVQECLNYLVQFIKAYAHVSKDDFGDQQIFLP